MLLDAMESFARGLVATSPEQRHAFFTRAARLDEQKCVCLTLSPCPLSPPFLETSRSPV
jgi:hypothetical protein